MSEYYKNDAEREIFEMNLCEHCDPIQYTQLKQLKVKIQELLNDWPRYILTTGNSKEYLEKFQKVLGIIPNLTPIKVPPPPKLPPPSQRRIPNYLSSEIPHGFRKGD